MPLNFLEGFKTHYENLTNWELYEKIIEKPLRKSIRVNTLKTTVDQILKKLDFEWILRNIPWIGEGFFIEHKEGKRKDIGNIMEHNQGHFYIQEAASMIPVLALNPKPGENILDMCTSPGSKTTQIVQMMANKGKITAADVRDDRIAILKRNISRMGIKNCEIVKKSGQQFKDVLFDKILVDALCSGTGTMREQE